MKKASGAQITHEKQSSTDKDKKNKDKTKDSQKETAEEKISILDKALEEGEISGSSTDGSVSGTEKKEKAVAEAAENPKLSEIWSQWGDTEKLVLLGGILGLCYLLFWLRAKRYQNKKVLKLSRLNA